MAWGLSKATVSTAMHTFPWYNMVVEVVCETRDILTKSVGLQTVVTQDVSMKRTRFRYRSFFFV
jgi:hypothetical protein